MSHQHLHTDAPTHQHTPAAFTQTPTPTLTRPEPNPNRGAQQQVPRRHPAGPPPLTPSMGKGTNPSQRPCGTGSGGVERGQEMEGKKDSVRHSVSQSSRAVGKLDAVPGGGKRPFMPCKMWGSQNQDPSRLGSEAGDAVPSQATSLGQPLSCHEQ